MLKAIRDLHLCRIAIPGAALVLVTMVLVAGCSNGASRPVVAGRIDLSQHVILVAGGSGRAGRYLLQGLKAEGLRFRATTRSLAEARQRLGADAEGVEWIEADVRDPRQIEAAMRGVDMVISVIGANQIAGPNSAEFVDYGGVKNLVDAAVKHKVRHFTLLTAIGTSDKNSFANKLFKGALEWRFRGEEYLRASGLGYTIVRPGGLVNEPAGRQGLLLAQGDNWRQFARATLARADLALVLIETLRNPGARRATFELVNDASLPADAWRQALPLLKPDP